MAGGQISRWTDGAGDPGDVPRDHRGERLQGAACPCLLERPHIHRVHAVCSVCGYYQLVASAIPARVADHAGRQLGHVKHRACPGSGTWALLELGVHHLLS